MSGVAGGNRVLSIDIPKIVLEYKKDVLENFSYFKAFKIAGSYNTKKDCGDIDLIIYVNGDNKRELKYKFIQYILNYSNIFIFPFKSEKYKNRFYYNSGEIVSILYKNIQIDNIFALSYDELMFKYKFLSMDASKQGLLIGISRTILLNENKNEIFKKLNIKEIPLQYDEEYEFILSSNSLKLRIIKLDSEYKTIDKYDYWVSKNWEDVIKLLSNYDLSNSFETLYEQVQKNNLSRRSITRIKGLFKSMVSVKSGEMNTDKGNLKIQNIDKINNL